MLEHLFTYLPVGLRIVTQRGEKNGKDERRGVSGFWTWRYPRKAQHLFDRILSKQADPRTSGHLRGQHSRGEAKDGRAAEGSGSGKGPGLAASLKHDAHPELDDPPGMTAVVRHNGLLQKRGGTGYDDSPIYDSGPQTQQ